MTSVLTVGDPEHVGVTLARAPQEVCVTYVDTNAPWVYRRS